MPLGYEAGTLGYNRPSPTAHLMRPHADTPLVQIPLAPIPLARIAAGLLVAACWAGATSPAIASELAPQPTSPPSTSPGVPTDLEVTIVPPPGEGEEYWSRWRGPSGQGVVVDGHDYASAWSAETNVRWRTEVPGFGFSSPIVWKDRIFLTTASPAPDGFWPAEGGEHRSILSYRRSDGELLWQAEVPDVAAPERTNPHNGHASSTPTTDGERVYAYFGNDGLLAVDFDGNVVWHRLVGRINAFQGTASSPLLYGDLVIVSQDHRGRDGSFIAAFDKRSGETVWRTARAARAGWSSPIAIRVDGRDQIVLSGSRRVISYDPLTGEEIWQAAGTTVETTPTPVVGESLLFCSSGRAGPTLAIRPDGRGDVTESHIVWQSPKGSPYVASPVVWEGILYMVNDTNGIATAYEAASGDLLWQGRLGRPRSGQSFYASPVAVDDRIYFTDDSGDTYVLAAGRDFELLRVNHLDETIRASPALVDGVWYIRTQSHLYAIAGDETVAEEPPTETTSETPGETAGETAPADGSHGPSAEASGDQRSGRETPADRPSQPAPETYREPSDGAVRVELTAEELAQGFVKLGNGSDLSDFLFVGASADNCAVEQDVIRCKGHPAGYFATRESYENYALRLDVRFPREIGNGGYLLHITGPHKLWPRSVEVQGHYLALGRVFTNTPGSGHGPRADNGEVREAVIRPAHEWNALEIVSRNGVIQTYLNGAQVVSYGPLPYTRGPIGFQLEGADLEFRNIRIRVDEEDSADAH